MKKIVLTILFIVFWLNAGAQWYLFPSAKQDSTNTSPSSVAMAEQDSIVIVKPDTVTINLFLPLGSMNENPSQAFSDFYCGSLMAIKECSGSGLTIKLKVTDILSEPCKLSTSVIGSADLNIGPVSYGDIENAVAVCPEGKYIISPLEKRVSELVSTHRIIQAPSGKKEQIAEMASWLKEDIAFTDRVFVLTDKTLEGETATLVKELENHGIQYDTVSVISFESIPANTPSRIVCALEKDEITGNAIVEIARMNRHGASITFYGTSGARTLNTVTITSLQQANAHICTSYNVEYSNESTREFVLRFREMFSCEPSQFAFSGYDTMLYFVKAFSEYGNQWVKKLPEFSRNGIQTDFKFESTDQTGLQNTAVKRILYKVTGRIVPAESVQAETVQAGSAPAQEDSGIGNSLL